MTESLVLGLRKSTSASGGNLRFRSAITLIGERVVPVGQLEAAFPGPARATDQLVVVRQLIRMNPHQRDRRRAQHDARHGQARPARRRRTRASPGYRPARSPPSPKTPPGRKTSAERAAPHRVPASGTSGSPATSGNGSGNRTAAGRGGSVRPPRTGRSRPRPRMAAGTVIPIRTHALCQGRLYS